MISAVSKNDELLEKYGGHAQALGIKIKPENKYQTDDAKFFKIVKAGFSQPRKQLINNLSKKLKINKQKINSLLFSAGVEPTQRAETLSINDWLDLSKVL